MRRLSAALALAKDESMKHNPLNKYHSILDGPVAKAAFLKFKETAGCHDLIFNAFGCPSLKRTFDTLPGDVKYDLLFKNTGYSELLEASPYLIEGSRVSGSREDSLLESCDSWGFWGFGSYDFMVAAAHWRSLLNVLMPDDSISHFRFYSSRIISSIIPACDDLELQWLLGPYGHLLIPLDDGKWLMATSPLLGRHGYKGISESYKPLNKIWWQVTDNQLTAFEDTLAKVFRDNLVMWLWNNDVDQSVLMDREFGSLESFVDKALARIKPFNFTETTHRLQMVRLYLYKGFEVEKTPAFESFLPQLTVSPDAAINSLTAQLEVSAL
jgi:hypothetical protein